MKFTRYEKTAYLLTLEPSAPRHHLPVYSRYTIVDLDANRLIFATNNRDELRVYFDLGGFEISQLYFRCSQWMGGHRVFMRQYTLRRKIA